MARADLVGWMQPESPWRARWPFHPKNLALFTAIIFFALALWTISMESANPPDALFWSSARTFASFLGGAGFTAWLSMSVYEYITVRAQDLAFRRQFASDMVRNLYGPVYDELIANLERMDSDMSGLNWSAGKALGTKYLALLAPQSLVARGISMGGLIAQHNILLEEEKGILQAKVNNFTAEYIKRLGAPAGSRPPATGAEARSILGATDHGIKEAYDRFLTDFEEFLRREGLTGTASDFDRQLREALLSSPEAKSLQERNARIKEHTQEMLPELKALIRNPYLA